MRRRILLLAVLGLATVAGAAPRRVTPLAEGWRFVKGDPAGAQALAADEAAWVPVRIPHSWNAVDGADGGGYYRGPGWYRLRLNVAPAQLGRRLTLRFEGASLTSRVYLNGEPLGEHKGGFTAFAFDVTHRLRAGANVLAVRVDNARQEDVAPLSGDFTLDGGLYRPVTLIESDPVGVSLLEEGGPGVAIRQTLAAGRADVDVRSILDNGHKVLEPVTLRTEILDARGKTVAKEESPVAIAPGHATEARARLAIQRPHLWDGVRDPYLYRVRVRVLQGGKTLDEVVQPLGLRAFSVDPAKGFVLNGRPYGLHGVNLHQGRPSVGWAVTPAMMEEDYGLVREMGCTAVRMAHYPHAEREVEICDQTGLAVWSEMALVNQVTDSDAFRENAKAQLREMIAQLGNHPSIVFWSLYNEPWINRTTTEAAWRGIVPALAAMAKAEDPGRLVTGAMNWGPDHWLTWSGDVASFNHYWGWYDASAADWGANLDREHAQTKGRPFSISEYGAGASAAQHEDPPKRVAPNSRWHPEEYQALVHEKVWPALAARPYVWGEFVWVMFDFASDGRNEGDRPGINDKGLVTADRKVRKDAFDYYKAVWTTEPFVALAGRRFSPRPPGAYVLKVYSSCGSVRLRLDGGPWTDLTLRQPGVFVAPSVALGRGNHRIEVEGSRGARKTKDSAMIAVAS